MKTEKNELQKKVVAAYDFKKKLEASLAAKKKRFHEFISKLVAINNLLKRNQLKSEQAGTVKFPFLLVLPESGPDAMIE